MINRLRDIRKKMGLTQQQLADVCELHRITITLIEGQKHVPDMTTLIKLVKGTQVPANKIFYDLDVV